MSKSGRLGAKLKSKKICSTVSGLKVLESDSNSRSKKKKHADKKLGHSIKVVNQEYGQRLSRCANRTVVEKWAKPAESMTLTEGS